ncbi:MAG: glutathione S-transferase C-terminal domain-containing protein [Acetatifactor sp.]|nr:glutathione S-transferase C-terminal domain-containing protein [Acetatifactor sp.]
MAEQIEKLVGELNEGVNRAGLAQSQAEYEKYYHLVFDRLDQIEKHLGENRFLLGDKLTEADVRLYVTLTRFDVAYYFGYRLNKKRIRDYHNLWNYAKELYSLPAYRDITDFDAIKRGYLLGAANNPDGIFPEGPDVKIWLETNDRETKFGPLKI